MSTDHPHTDFSREQFYQDLRQDVLATVEAAAEEEGAHKEEKFTELVLGLLADAGETENARECRDIREDSIGRKLHKVNGYALSENYETLDLFVTIYRGDDEPGKVGSAEIQSAANQCFKFLNNAIKRYADEIEESSPIFDLAQTLMRYGGDLARVNIFILTDAIATTSSPDDADLAGILVSYHLRDLEYLWRLSASKQQRIPIEINFLEKFGRAIPCLPIPSDNEDYEAYLCTLSGDVLASVYQTYGSRLLEQNVRSFLQLKGKINKGIRETVLKRPHMFLAFNNGIAATAEAVSLVTLSEGGRAISTIRDLQIVNGGQTTATIFHALRHDNADVSKVFVQMKLSVIKNTEHLSDIVSSISRYANTQNRVSDADLSSNHPFLVQLESLSRKIWAPPASGQTHQSHWFFERARGQYRQAQGRELGMKRRRLFEQQNPKSQVFVKEDVPRFIHAWGRHPWLVVRGNQKNYAEFMKGLKSQQAPDSIWFEDLVAKAILFRRAEKIYGVKPNSIGDMRYITVPYALAWLNEKTNGQIDLYKIWKTQETSSTLQELLRTVMEKIDRFIRSEAPNALYGEWAKKEECWNAIRPQSFNLDLKALEADFITTNQSQRYAKTEDDLERAEQMRQVERLKSVPIAAWKEIIEWGRITEQLSSYQRDLAYNIYKSIEGKKDFTEIQMRQGEAILDFVIAQKPEIFLALDTEEETTPEPSQPEEISLETIRALVEWDRRHKRLKDYEWSFLRELTEAKKPMNERNKSWAGALVKKMLKYGFRV